MAFVESFASWSWCRFGCPHKRVCKLVSKKNSTYFFREHTRKFLVFPNNSSKEHFVCRSSQSTEDQPCNKQEEVTEKVIREVTEVVDCVNIHVRLASLGGRRRKISGGLKIETSVHRVWNVMTEYEKLPEILPNILEARVTVDEKGRKMIEQLILLSKTLRIQSRIIVTVQEEHLKTLRFTKYRSRDFEEFDGVYYFNENNDGSCQMNYNLVATPNPLFPVAIVERKIMKEVPKMLSNIRDIALRGEQTHK
eukprot:jgi/Galph1/857/GphlegSOOS_G5705.1